LKKAAGAESSGSLENGKLTNEAMTSIVMAKVFELIKRLCYLGAAFLVFTMIFKQVTLLF
jgi:hypothetical protein